ncbi:hypothetical protein B0H13DRAFT_1665666 [Mycena leptocephala]|nr:hypothetical protein B0H13DRAFT_1665666 [Mycena leptocephala]
MSEWRPLRDEYLTENLRLDGLSNLDGSHGLCASCQKDGARFRCRICFGEGLYCSECCVRMHESNLLHVVDEWNGRCFERTSLCQLGLRIQFGHAGCVRPCKNDKFVVLDLGYIHVVATDFCGCEREYSMGPARTQLLRRRWWPATHDNPKTAAAATFRVLDFFLVQTLQAKTTMYDFYTALEKLTDATGYKPPNQYREFLRMAQQYRHLLMVKRAGQGHAEDSVLGTKSGELAIECPVCPRPGVNLPDDWAKARCSCTFNAMYPALAGGYIGLWARRYRTAVMCL